MCICLCFILQIHPASPAVRRKNLSRELISLNFVTRALKLDIVILIFLKHFKIVFSNSLPSLHFAEERLFELFVNEQLILFLAGLYLLSESKFCMIKLKKTEGK